jgi:hypothetical protein
MMTLSSLSSSEPMLRGNTAHALIMLEPLACSTTLPPTRSMIAAWRTRFATVWVHNWVHPQTVRQLPLCH